MFQKNKQKTNHGQEFDTINDKWNDSSPKQTIPTFCFFFFINYVMKNR